LIPKQPEGYLGGNHIFSAEKKLVRLQSGRNETIAFQLLLNGTADSINIKYNYPDLPELKTPLYSAG